MPARLVSIDRDTPMLLPPDLRDWVPEDHLVHFIIDAVALLILLPRHRPFQQPAHRGAHAREWRRAPVVRRPAPGSRQHLHVAAR